MSGADELPSSAPAERNKEPILQVLQRLLPREARVLEIASGWGQHAQHFARAQAGWAWQPSDFDASRLAVIDSRCAGLGNARPALQLDVTAPAWPAAVAAGAPYDALLCVNMLHASPWATCPGLMRGAATHLAPGGLLLLYGPYRVDGRPTAPSNEAFDADLRARDPAWGLRALADVEREAAAVQLALREVITMPANNLFVVFEKR
jgi:cyclopropane fatty-acyl-phospholipid synthase-like methyltransferase